MTYYYKVAVDMPQVKSIFTYAYPAVLKPGTLVELPLGRRKARGVVLEETLLDFDASKIKSIASLFEDSFHLSPMELKLYDWMGRYYHYPVGKLVFDCIPKILKRPRKFIQLDGEGQTSPFTLNKQQRDAFKKISAQLHCFSQHYLHGITGSGKSVVFLELIQSVLKKGQSCQFLLPEINLTPQFVGMFQRFLDVPIYSYHSGVTPSEKYTIWKTVNETETPVLVMGVRSSLFLPIKNLGLIVVDEEHDQSYNQQDRCPYNGRDVAIKKAQLMNIPIVLGSATPTVENYSRFKNKNYYVLDKRAGDGAPSVIETVDLAQQEFDADIWPLSERSVAALKEAVHKGEQALVFINKLGFSSFLQCRNCKYQFKNHECGCDNNLRFFKKKNMLSCAHCEFKKMAPKQCPECGGLSILNHGFGVEKVEEVLSKLQLGRVGRFDRDAITSFKELESQLAAFESGELDILVGTQMLSKGHNFEKVNLVVVLGIDSILNHADFRSSERAYALTTQIAGRGGRFKGESLVLIETLNPQHEIFETLKTQSMQMFYENEIPLRQIASCPPFAKMAMIFFSSKVRQKLIDTSESVALGLKELISKNKMPIKLYGPAPLMVEKKADQFSWGILVKSSDITSLHHLLTAFEEGYRTVSGVSFKIDVDPTHIL